MMPNVNGAGGLFAGGPERRKDYAAVTEKC